MRIGAALRLPGHGPRDPPPRASRRVRRPGGVRHRGYAGWVLRGLGEDILIDADLTLAGLGPDRRAERAVSLGRDCASTPELRGRATAKWRSVSYPGNEELMDIAESQDASATWPRRAQGIRGLHLCR